MKNNTSSKEPFENNQIIAVANFFLISLMLSFFAFILGRFINILNPGWQAIGFQVLAFFVAFESLLLRYYQRRESRFFQNKLLGTISELIIIILITKLVSMLFEGFSSLWIQITSWQEDFLGNFFDPSSMFYIFGILFIWMLTWLFSEPINKLEEDHELMEQEKLGAVFTDRREARRRLINLIFILGFSMILLVSSIKYLFESQPLNQIRSSSLLIVLILYFATGFIFLSINQYAIMKAYWYINDISVNPDLLKKWVFYSILFIFFVVILIIFLPKDFDIELNQFMKQIFSVFVNLFTLIQFVIIFPIIFILTLISSLFSGEPIQGQIQEQVQEYVPTFTQPNAQIPWLELVKTILFWLVFLVTIFFAVRFYITNNLRIKSIFDDFHLVGWVKDFWNWLKEGFLNLQRKTVKNYKSGIENIRKYFKKSQRNLSKLTGIIRKKPPRQDVIMTYVEWVQWNNELGLKRKTSQTPMEFAQICNQYNDETTGMVNTFTDTFITARYSTHPINEQQAQEARRLLAKLKEAYEKKQEIQETDNE